MRSIILTEEALREAIEAGCTRSETSNLGELIEVAIRKKVCERIEQDLIDAVMDCIEDNTCTPDTDTIFDAILDQAQRVGTVTDLL